MAGKYVEPEFGVTPFTCPHCDTLAPQESAAAAMTRGRTILRGSGDMFLTKCTSCGRSAVWIEMVDYRAWLDASVRSDLDKSADPAAEDPEPTTLRMVYPRRSAAPNPNADLPENVLIDYKEAADVLGVSPRSAAALLRLGLQKLCAHFGQSGMDINKDIGDLVKAGTIRPMVQQAMDTVRISGNESVHPGELNVNDDRELALSLFDFVNLIADEAISQPNKIQAMYSKMPEAKRDAVARRDSVA